MHSLTVHFFPPNACSESVCLCQTEFLKSSSMSILCETVGVQYALSVKLTQTVFLLFFFYLHEMSLLEVWLILCILTSLVL